MASLGPLGVWRVHDPVVVIYNYVILISLENSQIEGHTVVSLQMSPC
jgi:hypothetical protein